MKRGFLSQKGSGDGRGVKEKSLNRNLMNSSSGIGVFTKSDDTMNEDTLVVVVSTVKEGVTPSVVDMMVEKETICSLEETTVPEYFSTLTTPVTSMAGNPPGKSSYVNITGKPSRKIVNVRTLFTLRGNGIDMAVLGRSSYARLMIQIQADMDLKDNIVASTPKITREGHCTCAGEKKTMRMPSQTSRGVLVGPKIGFKPQKEYRHVSTKPNASSSGNKKKGVKLTIEVSNSNQFDVLNLVDNDVEFGTNGGATNLVNNKATSSGSSFMNLDNDGEFASNSLIGEKIDKIKRQICKCKLRLLDNDGNSLVHTGIMESDSEVKVVFDETIKLRISKSGKDRSDKFYGVNRLLEQWRDSYPDNDDYDTYDDDMCKNHDLFKHLRSICDDLDIIIHGRKKKYIF
nr:hypothetical protein [Tanacetum cinerariifolium]